MHNYVTALYNFHYKLALSVKNCINYTNTIFCSYTKYSSLSKNPDRRVNVYDRGTDPHLLARTVLHHIRNPHLLGVLYF